MFTDKFDDFILYDFSIDKRLLKFFAAHNFLLRKNMGYPSKFLFCSFPLRMIEDDLQDDLCEIHAFF